MKLFHATLGLVTVFAVACASTNVPQTRIVSVETAVHSARVSGAANVSGADEQLKKAEDELNQAKTIISNKGDAEQAEALLTRAESDAALAAALSREAGQKGKEAPQPSAKPPSDTSAQPPVKPRPDMNAPTAKPPEVNAPDVNAPTVKPPEMNAPTVKPPEVNAPTVKPPEVNAPTVKPPEVNAPTVKPQPDPNVQPEPGR